MPVLAIGGEKSLGDALGQQLKLVATDGTIVVLKDTGDWVLEERPKETTDALIKFLRQLRNGRLLNLLSLAREQNREGRAVE